MPHSTHTYLVCVIFAVTFKRKDVGFVKSFTIMLRFPKPVDGVSQVDSLQVTSELTMGSGSSLCLPDGSVSAPSLKYTNDVDTGLYRSPSAFNWDVNDEPGILLDYQMTADQLSNAATANDDLVEVVAGATWSGQVVDTNGLTLPGASVGDSTGYLQVDPLSAAVQTVFDGATPTFALAIWVKLVSTGTTVYGLRFHDGTGSEHVTFYWNSAGYFEFGHDHNGSTWNIQASMNTITYATDTWYHLAWTADATSNQVYLNGTDVSTLVLYNQGFPTDALTTIPNIDELHVHANWNAGNVGDLIMGRVTFSSNWWTAAQVLSHYQDTGAIQTSLVNNTTRVAVDSGGIDMIVQGSKRMRLNNGQILVTGGAVGAPAVAFDDDTLSGVYQPGAGQLGLATHGVLALDVQADQNVDFPVSLSVGGSSTLTNFTESTYSAVLGDASGNNFTLTTNDVDYIRLNAFVMVIGRLAWSSKGSASGNIIIQLPHNITTPFGVGSVIIEGFTLPAGKYEYWLHPAGVSNRVNIVYHNDAGAVSIAQDTDFSATGTLFFQITFRTSD
jgi:hypothetical protein